MGFFYAAARDDAAATPEIEVHYITSMTDIPDEAEFVLVMFGSHAQQTRHSRGFTLLVPRTHNAAIDEIALQHTIEAARGAAERNRLKFVFVYE